MFVNIDLSEVSKPHGFLLLQHFSNFWNVLFVDIELDFFCNDSVLVLAHMFFNIIDEVVVNQSDTSGVVMALRKHIAFGLLSFRHNT